VLRVTNQDLIKALKKQEMVGTVRLGAFAQIGQTSASIKHSSSMDEDAPTCDPDVPAEDLESIGTLAQLKGMTWSTQDNVEMVRPLGSMRIRQVNVHAQLQRLRISSSNIPAWAKQQTGVPPINRAQPARKLVGYCNRGVGMGLCLRLTFGRRLEGAWHLPSAGPIWHLGMRAGACAAGTNRAARPAAHPPRRHAEHQATAATSAAAAQRAVPA
jgi:hypothetical protein